MSFDTMTLEYDKVLKILKNFAKTDYAKRLIDDLKPDGDFDNILKLQNQTKEAYTAIIKYNDIPLGGLYDIKEAILRAKVNSVLNESELLDVVSLIDCINNVNKYFTTLNQLKIDTTNNSEIVKNLIIPGNLKTNITLAITPDAKVSDNASKELFMIRRNISSLENRLRNRLNELLQTRHNLLTEPLIVIRNNRMCLPVKIEFKNSFGGIVHDISSSNTTCYIEPKETIDIANQIESFKNQEKIEVLAILKNLSLLVGAVSNELILDIENLTKLDIIYAKALMGKEYDYNAGNIENKQAFYLKNAKHPLIGKDKVVPINIEIGKKFDSIIITGPNTGGKTIALKTTGLLHLMAYSGMMVPTANDSVFGFFDNILVDIGDEQSIEQSLSTFSSHMKKIINIMNEASFQSLILLDELGSGTDPKEGSSLAIAILSRLQEIGSKVICTTHYSELKNYAYNNPRVCNASVEFNTETLLPTYRLLLGVPGRSNALEIAYKLGLDEKIIETSRQYLSDSLNHSSTLVKNLEEEMTNIRHKEEELEHKINQYNGMLESLKKEKLDLINETNNIIANAKKQANKVLIDAKEEATKLITEIKNMSDENFKEHELASLKHKINTLDVKQADSVIDYDFKVGDFVLIKSYQKYGTITKVKKDKYTVNVGQFQMDFSKDELVLSAKPTPKPVKKTNLSGYNSTQGVGMSLDLRGKRYEEVAYLLDQYLDKAILANYESVTIIHGFGSGAVRNAVQSFLKNCPYVKSYRYGKEGEGLNGVTIVYLK